jgi:type IV pilus assembly protein PilV
MTSPKKMAGFSLIEVLVAFLILLVGLLGMAGLQATSLRNNHSAYLRSQATLMAYDIMDRMRANRTAALAGSYARDFGDTQPIQTCPNYCAAVDIALADEWEWVNSLNRLPSGDGSISVTNSGIATVNVRWDDVRDTNDLTTFRLVTQL